jgi:hypothetical protein
MKAASARTAQPSRPSSLGAPVHLLGLLPLVFFVAHLSFYWRSGGLGNMLWICTVSNLALAIGLFFGLKWLIRLAVLWLIPGLPLWLYYLAVNGGWLATSFLTHVGALIVGLSALHETRSDRWTWLHASLYFLSIQQLSRMFTTPDLNVNVAHSIYPGWEDMFGSYRQYWLATTAIIVTGLWLLGLIVLRLFPPADGPTDDAAGVSLAN